LRRVTRRVARRVARTIIERRKHEDICGVGVPALNIVGDACVNHLSAIRLYVSMAASMSVLWMPRATRMSMCCGRSTTLPFILSRYERSSVLKPKKS
jgi:hypothetical protein